MLIMVPSSNAGVCAQQTHPNKQNLHKKYSMNLPKTQLHEKQAFEIFLCPWHGAAMCAAPCHGNKKLPGKAGSMVLMKNMQTGPPPLTLRGLLCLNEDNGCRRGYIVGIPPQQLSRASHSVSTCGWNGDVNEKL